MALLQRADPEPPILVRVADDVGGWLVKSIDPLSVLLKHGAREQRYKLFDQDAAALNDPDSGRTDVPGRRINHPVVDIGRNLRNKPQP